jgi:N-acyl homoserine lactone hydrolase
MPRNSIRWFLVIAAAVIFAFAVQARSDGQLATFGPPKAPNSVRLYVFDCGTLHVADMGRFQLKKEEVSTTDLSVACFLITHPKGTLMWDTGAVADAAWKPTGDRIWNLPASAVEVPLVLPDGQKRDVTMHRSLRSQLAEVGYTPGEITYLALSHYHYDHTANANDFFFSTWLVRQVERDAMFAEMPPATTDPRTYSKLRDSKTKIISTDDYDVFGDGTVVIKFAPGHTPGHQVLYVKLGKTGGVVLSGDLYHFPEERALGRVPTIDFNQDQTRASRAAIEAFLKQSSAQLWIQHDFVGNAKLKKSPGFYD